MGFEIKENEIKYYNLGDLTKGMTLTSIYGGSSQGGEFNTYTHYFNEDDGSKIGLSGCADLDKRLALVAIGDKVKIVFNGKKKIQTKHGAVQAYQFWVEKFNEDGTSAPVLLAATGASDDSVADPESLRA